MALTHEDYLAVAPSTEPTEEHRHGMVVCQCGAVLSRCACAHWPIIETVTTCDRCKGAAMPPPTPPEPPAAEEPATAPTEGG